MSLVFIDLEASSLERGGFPIEIGWVCQAGIGESHLIRPIEAWHVWSLGSEQTHGISRPQLTKEGGRVEVVAKRAAAAFSGHTIVADQPDWDGRWLGMLLAAGGIQSIEVVALSDVLTKACYPLLRLLAPPGSPDREQSAAAVRKLAEGAIRDAQYAESQLKRVHHRALPDAESNWRVWADTSLRVDQILGEADRQTAPASESTFII